MPTITATQITEARELASRLTSRSKKEVTEIYGRTCCGRVSNPAGGGLSKGQMVYDVVRARLGRNVALAAL